MNAKRSISFLTAALTLCSGSVFAKNKHKKTDSPQDQIEVLAHLPLPAGRVDQLLLTHHYRRNYLYAERSSDKAVTLLDVTDAERPAILSASSLSASGSDSVLLTVAGNAALVGDGSTAPSAAADRTIRILSFADPAHPAVQHEFQHVSSITRDDGRGLIFLTNADGLWILHEHLAQDPAEVAQWEHDMLGNR